MNKLALCEDNPHDYDQLEIHVLDTILWNDCVLEPWRGPVKRLSIWIMLKKGMGDIYGPSFAVTEITHHKDVFSNFDRIRTPDTSIAQTF